MRIWSLHPKYLDSKGLVALWREALLAKSVLEGRTKAYSNHPQLYRFKKSENAVHSMNQYLTTVYEDAFSRGYNFDKNKINLDFTPATLTVTTGQLRYEKRHLLNKLLKRDSEKFNKLSEVADIDAHPLFMVVDGKIEEWEILKSKSGN